MDLFLITELIEEFFPELPHDEAIAKAYEVFSDSKQYVDLLDTAFA